MPTPILFVILIASGILWAILGLGYKLADHYQARTTAFTRVFMLTGCAISVVAALIFQPTSTTWGDPRLWLAGLFFGILFYAVLLILMPAYQMGPASIIWTVVNLGLLVPVFVAPQLAAFFQRPPEVLFRLDFLALGLFVIMLIVFERGMAQGSREVKSTGLSFLLILIAIFLANGVLLTGGPVMKYMFVAKNSYGFIACYSAAAALFTLVVDLVRREPIRPTPGELKAGLLAGASSGLGMICYMTALVGLPTTVVLMINGGISLMGGVLITATIFRERLNLLKAAGLALGVGVLMIYAFRKPLVTRCPILDGSNPAQVSLTDERPASQK